MEDSKYFKWINPEFNLESEIGWSCPTCNFNSLKIDKEKFISEETIESEREHQDINWETCWIRYNFIGILRCSNEKCKSIITFSGYGGVEEHIFHNRQGETESIEYCEYYVPQYFNPTPLAFKLAVNCPEKVKQELIKAFSLYWIDISASANRLRTSIELMMDYHKIPKVKLTKKKKRVKLTLHERIELFGKKEPNISDFLLAIKWIGNSGSHSIDTLTKQDLVDAFKILDFTFEKIYSDREKMVSLIVKSINKTKKPRSAVSKKLLF